MPFSSSSLFALEVNILNILFACSRLSRNVLKILDCLKLRTLRSQNLIFTDRVENDIPAKHCLTKIAKLSNYSK